MREQGHSLQENNNNNNNDNHKLEYRYIGISFNKTLPRHCIYTPAKSPSRKVEYIISCGEIRGLLITPALILGYFTTPVYKRHEALNYIRMEAELVGEERDEVSPGTLVFSCTLEIVEYGTAIDLLASFTYRGVLLRAQYYIGPSKRLLGRG